MRKNNYSVLQRLLIVVLAVGGLVGLGFALQKMSANKKETMASSLEMLEIVKEAKVSTADPCEAKPYQLVPGDKTMFPNVIVVDGEAYVFTAEAWALVTRFRGTEPYDEFITIVQGPIEAKIGPRAKRSKC